MFARLGGRTGVHISVVQHIRTSSAVAYPRGLTRPVDKSKYNICLQSQTTLKFTSETLKREHSIPSAIAVLSHRPNRETSQFRIICPGFVE